MVAISPIPFDKNDIYIDTSIGKVKIIRHWYKSKKQLLIIEICPEKRKRKKRK